MKVEFRRPAFVRGFCKAKALIRVEYGSVGNYFWLESSSPYDSSEAKEINLAVNEIENKLK